MSPWFANCFLFALSKIENRDGNDGLDWNLDWNIEIPDSVVENPAFGLTVGASNLVVGSSDSSCADTLDWNAETLGFCFGKAESNVEPVGLQTVDLQYIGSFLA